jgi:hypothetical protein
MAPIEIDRASIEDQGPSRMIGDETVIPEANGVGFSRSCEVWSISVARAP